MRLVNKRHLFRCGFVNHKFSYHSHSISLNNRSCLPMMQLFRHFQLTQFFQSSSLSRYIPLHFTLGKLESRVESEFIYSSRNLITWSNNHPFSSSLSKRPNQVVQSSRRHLCNICRPINMAPTISPSSATGISNQISSTDHNSIARSLKTSAANLGSQELLNLPPIPSKEIKFPVSWGHIAAQEWGDPNGIPVLAIHGWLDNSSSFEPIVPYLLASHNLHIIAIDEPGCGLSSHKPPGSDYNRWAHLREIKRILDQLNWKEGVTLMGHSLGAIYSLLFASIYPNLIKRVISIDIVKPPTSFADGWASRLPKLVDKHIEYDKLFMNDPTMESTAPVYTRERAIEKMMEGHGNSLTKESAELLMKRGAKPFKDGFMFTRDIRQKLPPLDPSPTEETMIKFISRIKSDLMIVRAKQGVYQTPDSVRQQYYAIYERNCRLFRDILTDGTHHLHMNNPQTVGAIINDFLSDSLHLSTGLTFPKSTL